jgi:hypothetical protein
MTMSKPERLIRERQPSVSSSLPIDTVTTMMRRFGRPAVLALLIAVVIHADWHFARPTHHRLSLGWPQHWIFAAIGFAIVGWVIARLFERPYATGAAVLALAVIVAQAVEPVAEVVIYQGRIGYPNDPGRWGVFALCLAAGIPAFIAALFFCRPRRTTGEEDRMSFQLPLANSRIIEDCQ